MKSGKENIFFIKSVHGLVYFLLFQDLVGSNEYTRSQDGILNPEWGYPRRYRQNESPSLSSSSSALTISQTFPKFRSPPLKLLIQRGDRILLPCIVEDLGENQILWRHKKNIIAGSNISAYSENSGRIRLYQNFTLEISHISFADEGEYICSLVSPYSSQEITHTVSVQDPPTVTILPAKGSIEVNEGETVQMGCVPQGNPTPRIAWTRRDGPLPRNYQKFHNESVITMEQVSRKHSGLYVCTADNGIGLPAIGAVYLRVMHTPEVEVPKRRVHGGVGYRATLICIVHADPKAEVLWYIGQKQKLVPLSDRVHVETRANKEFALVINSVRESDFGMYGCVANSSMGFDLRHIELSGVSNPPVISRWETLPLSQESLLLPPRRKTSRVFDNLNLNLKSGDEGKNTNKNENENETTEETTEEDKTSEEEIEKNSNSNPSQSQRQSQKKIRNPSPIDVQVQLFWAVECYSSLIDYRLAFRPAPSRPLTAYTEDKSPVWTELTIPADTSSTFLHTKSYTLRGLNRDTIYEAAIKARNKYGWSPISSVCYFATFPNSSSSDASAIKEYITDLESGDASESPSGTKRRYLHPYLESRLRRLNGRDDGDSGNSTAFSASTSTSAAATHQSNHQHVQLLSIITITIFMTTITVTGISTRTSEHR